MARDIVSERRHSAELRYLQGRLPLPARSPSVAAAQQTNGSSSVFLLFGAWRQAGAFLSHYHRG
jgi:hypothetical protein